MDPERRTFTVERKATPLRLIALAVTLGLASPAEALFQPSAEPGHVAVAGRTSRRGVQRASEEVLRALEAASARAASEIPLHRPKIAPSVLDDGHVLQEADGANAAHPSFRRYHYGYGPLSVTDTNGKRFIQTDALGSPTDLTSTSGAIASMRKYDAWGSYREATAPSPGDEKLGFTGHQYDPETGLVYARARYYDSELGLFLSRDPLDRSPLSAPYLHRYTWGRGNPLKFVDPTGWAEELAKTPPTVNEDGTWSDGEGADEAGPAQPAACASNTGACDSAEARDPLVPDPETEQFEKARAAAKRSMAAAGDATEMEEAEEGGVVATLKQIVGKIASVREEGRRAGKEEIKPTFERAFEETIGKIARASGGRFRTLPDLQRDVEKQTDSMRGRVADEGAEATLDAGESLVVGGVAKVGGGLRAAKATRAEAKAAVAEEKALARRAATGTGGPDEAFHYTFSRHVSSIQQHGLRAGSYATPTGALSPLQAQIDLALPPNRGLPGALLRIDLDGMRKAGYQVPSVNQVARSFGMPGGGYEMQFSYPIPPQFITVVRP